MSKKSEFHITIGAALEGSQDIAATVEHHLRLAKAAILYADKVTLCSPIALLLTSVSSISSFTERQQVELLEMVIPSLAQDEETRRSGAEFCRIYRQLHSNRKPSVQELQARVQIQRAIQPSLDGLKEKAREMVQLYKVDQFEVLLKTNRLELKPLGRQLSPVQWIASSIQKAAELDAILRTGQFNAPTLPGNSAEDSDKMMEDFLKELERAIKSASSYPLFDDFTGNLVRLGLKEGKIDASEIQRNRAKPVGLAADLMERLPTFGSASVNEILDIRKALDKPLVNFRSAMIKFSRDMKTAAWDEDFPIEAEEVFRAEVQPAVAEMEDSVRSNKWLHELAYLLPEKPLSIPAGGALGAGFSALSQLPEVMTTTIGAAAGLGLVALEARKKWAEKQASAESNQLFFYYKAGKMLAKGKS